MLSSFKIKLIAALCLPFLSALLLPSASAQAQKPWTLTDCIRHAYQHNLSIRKARLGEQMAKVDRTAAIGAFLPDLSATASNSYNFGMPVNDQTHMRDGDVQNINVGLQASLTLFDGLKNIRNLQRAELDQQVKASRTETTKNDIALSVAQAYLRVLLSKAVIQIDETQLQIDRDELSRVERQIRTGTRARADRYDTQRTLAADAQKLTEGKNDYILNRLKLAQLLQLEDYEDFRVADVALSIPAEPLAGYDPEALYRKALLSRPEVTAARLEIQRAERGVSLAKGAYMPTLTGGFNLSSRYSKHLEQNHSGIPQEGDSFKHLKDNETYSAGLSLKIPLFNRFQVKRNVQRAGIQVREAHLGLEQAQNELRQNIAQAYAQARASHSAYLAARKTEKAARITFEYARNRFVVGALNSFDFDRAKNNLAQAETDVERAKYNCFFRLKVLDFYAGIPLSLQ